MTTDSGPDPAFAASPSSQSSLSRPSGLQSGVGFTPGPWEIRPSVEYDCDWEVYKPSPDSISGTGDGEPWYLALVHDGAEGADAEANARLIAAAPDLYEACESVIPSGVCLTNKNIPDGFTVALDCTMGDLRKVAAALAKARGEQ